MIGEDERLAAVAVVVDYATASGSYIVIPGIARGVKNGIRIDQQRDACL
jgi:hypothetical protein